MGTDKMIHAELNEAIIGAAMKVLNTLKPGLDEKAYENAPVIELRKRGTALNSKSDSMCSMRAKSSTPSCLT